MDETTPFNRFADYLRTKLVFAFLWFVGLHLIFDAINLERPLPSYSWVFLLVYLGAVYSICLKWKRLESFGWNRPKHWHFWLLAVCVGIVVVCMQVLLARIVGQQLQTGLSPVPVIVLSVTVGPIGEEILFRGWILSAQIRIMAWLGAHKGFANFVANLVAAVAFAWAHDQHDWYFLAVRTLWGVSFGLLRLRSGSVAVAAAAHSAANAAVVFI